MKNIEMKRSKKSWIALLLILSVLCGFLPGLPAFALTDGSVNDDGDIVTIQKENYTLKVDKNGFRYGFYKPDGTPYADMHGESGIRFGVAGGEPAPAVSSEFKGYSDDIAAFEVTNGDGNVADVTLELSETSAKLEIKPREIQDNRYPNRYMQLEPNVEGSSNNIKVLNLDRLTDHYTIEADVRFDDVWGTSAGVLAHYTESDDYQLFFIKAGAAGLKRMNGKESKYDFGSKACNAQAGKWHHLKMSVTGKSIKCYLNGELIYDVTDDVDASLLSGGCGVRAYRLCDFDNVRIIDGSDGTAAYEEDFEDVTEDDVKQKWLNKIGNDPALADEPTPSWVEEQYYVIDARVGGLPHTYGLGDLGTYDNDNKVRSTANILGTSRMSDGKFASNNPSVSRYISGFVIAPDRDFAMVVFETDDKRVSLQTDESLLGGLYTKKLTLYYFFGDTRQIYGDYREAREAEGYYDTKPRYPMFGVGWEAYGSLGWNVYQTSVEETVDTFLDEGYKLTWAVVGSGFWKGDRKGNEGLTTSFGMWDDTYEEGRQDDLPNPRFPDPDGMKQFFNDRNIPLLLGLRINFRLPADPYGGKYIEEVDGPFTLEGLTNGYFLKDHRNGELAVTDKLGLPSRKSVCAFVDGSNPEAVEWYADNALKWGVQGFKEDTMLYTSLHDDSNYNPILTALTEDKEQLMIVRSAAYSLPGDILRANDFNFGMDSNRMPLNLGAFAASGQGNVYPDILGGTGGSTSNSSFNLWTSREAWLDALCPSMSVGLPLWTIDNETYKSAIKKAVTFHSTYAPYIYSAAVKNYETGYPYAHTPLYIAYPEDSISHELYNTDKQTWEWMVGESLLAAPIWGTNYLNQTARDIYLPEGEWMDIETGEIFEGPITLEDYELPVDKTPAFIGGQGILVGEDIDEENLTKPAKECDYFVEVYPVAQKGTVYDYTYVDGETTSTITANMDGFNPATLTVTDTTDKKRVEFTVEEKTSAIRFAYEAGHDYELTGGASEGKMQSVSLSCDSITAIVGDTIDAAARPYVVMDDGSKVTDLSGFDKVEYEAGNNTILSVAEDGTVTALKVGITTLRVGVTKEEQTLWSEPIPVTVNAKSITVTLPTYDAELYNPGFTVTGTTQGVASLEAVLRSRQTDTAVDYKSLDYQDGAFSIAYTNVPDGEYILTLTGMDANGETVAEKKWPLTMVTAANRMIDRFDGTHPLEWKAADENGTWQVESGVLKGSMPTGATFYIADPQIMSQYFLSSDMRIQSGSLSGGLVFGYQDSKNYYHVRFEKENKIQLYHFTTESNQLAEEVPYSYSPEKIYNLAMDVKGKQINVYVNDVQVLSYTFDGDIPEGKAGYRLYKMTAEMDNFTIYPGINTGLVKTSYVDAGGNPLTDPVSLRKPVGAGYETERKEFTGHTLREVPENASGTVAEGTTEVTYVYKREAPVNGTVTVQYVDENGTAITTPDVLTGEVGTLYEATPKTFEDYTLESTEGEVRGRYRENSQSVVFHYRKGVSAVPVTGVKLNRNEVTLYTNHEPCSIQLTANVEPANAANKKITWSFSNPDVVTVDAIGVDTAWMTAISEGTATITVATEDGGFTDTCEVTVTTEAPILYNITVDAGIANGTVTADKASAAEGEKVTLTVTPDENYRLVEDSLKVYKTGDPDIIVHVTTDDVFVMPAYDVTITARFEQIPEPETYTLTINAGTGGSIREGESGNYAAGMVISIAASAKRGYRFSGWTTSGGGAFGNSNSASTTFVMPEADVVVTAVFTRLHEQDDDDDDDTPKTPKIDVIREGTTQTVSAGIKPVNHTETGTSYARISSSILSALADKANELQGPDEKSVIEINVESQENARKVEADFPRAAFRKIAEDTESELKVSAGVGSVTFDRRALEAIHNEAPSGDIRITIGKAENSSLSPDVQSVAGNRPVYHLAVEAGDSSVTSFGGGTAFVSLPYTPAAGEDEDCIVVYYLDDAGGLKPARGRYDRQTGMVSFVAGHFSSFMIGYNKVTFDDVDKDDWYDRAVGFMAARGAVKGRGDGSFGPEENVTRADFLVILMNAYGIEPDETMTDNFADAGNKYYTGYLGAARRLGIAAGVGENRYLPEVAVSRQDMFVLLYRALEVLGELPEGSGGRKLESFDDGKDIAAYAKDAIGFLAEAGIVNGSGTSLAPEATSTRAQATQTLYNLLSK